MRHLLVRSLIISAVATLGVFTAGAAHASVSGPEQDPVFAAPPGTAEIQVAKLTHAQATARLRAAGITWSSSGGCSDRNKPNCTSFEQVNLATIQGAETLKGASGCALNVTGGTETGHASGTYSHWNGYKLDFGLATCVNNYVRNNFTSVGGNQWRSGSGNIYYLESNHWDVTYYNCGGC
ncbi:hypothetical protein [Kibdelosporangium phytohabitans]|uniref:Peptidase M15B domain-containing protein n=1 Tax=Kibdelosporangium phytohabitans TaxID=860235 RepID=A0A0N9I3J8_9PSEU|nr:hypothetical protein [Kibdelosporangium phytohabitans]ALG12398.1 hypothetical protein AOZ06_41015 [Kibdelosporangium phytohabitans]MBE1463978.1 hypothetical protein [Kibdelosporangium phytohabitans]